MYIHIHPSIHPSIHTSLHFHARCGRRMGRGGREGGGGGERSRCGTGYHSRQDEPANGATQAGALAQSCVHAVHDSGS